MEPAASPQTQLLDHTETWRKIRRIAWQIYEQNATENTIYLAGISGRGYLFAQMLKNELAEIAELQVELIEVQLDKEAVRQTEITLQPALTAAEPVVVLVDDVLNSGRTIAHAMRPFLQKGVQKLQIAVLVNRNHLRYPVTPTFAGYTLATTLQQHIRAELDNKDALSVQLL